VAIIFSPVTGGELDPAYTPRPKHAFLMLHAGDGASDTERTMASEVRGILLNLGFTGVAATDVSGTGDFLGKIVDLIRGCGFGVAIYSNETPARTLGNIFFEIGVSHLLGKPVQLLVAGENPTPSDFVRTEWVHYDVNRRTDSLTKLRQSIEAIAKQSEMHFKLAETVLEAEIVDYELAFERYKQAVLVTDDSSARDRIIEISQRLSSREIPQNMENHRQRLLNTIRHFVNLLPTKIP